MDFGRGRLLAGRIAGCIAHLSARAGTPSVLLLVVLMALTVGVTVSYVRAERVHYAWDSATFHTAAVREMVYLRELAGRGDALGGLIDWLAKLRLSTGEWYSDWHTVPVLPLLLIAGTSHLAYVGILALVYLVPFALLIGGMARILVPARPWSTFWIGAFATLLTPAAWLPTLRAYPDTGAAALVLAAVLLYGRDPRLREWRSIALIGGLLAAAILFRRHFAYAAIAFIASMAIGYGLELALAGRAWRSGLEARAVLGRLARIAAVPLGLALFLLLFGLPFVQRVLSTDFHGLYASYQWPPQDNVRYYATYYGFVPIIAAGVGLLVTARLEPRARAAAAFVAILGLVSLGQWALIVRQLDPHYTLHFTPTVVLGLVAAHGAARAHLTGSRRWLGTRLVELVVMVCFVVGLAPSRAIGGIEDPAATVHSSTIGALPMNRPPMRRVDYDETVRLVDRLVALAAPDEPIFVASSSAILSGDLLWQLHRRRYVDERALSYRDFYRSPHLSIIRWTPTIISGDPLPLADLVRARWVVIATPTQHQLQGEGPDLVDVVVDAFVDGHELAGDFERLPEEFHLADGVTVTLYRRLRETSVETAVQALRTMEAALGRRPGGQGPWLGLTPREH